MHAEEGGKNFNELILEKICREIDKLKAVLGNVSKEEEIITKEEKIPDTNNSIYKVYSNNISGRTYFTTKIPLPIGMVMKTRRRLNLTLDYND